MALAFSLTRSPCGSYVNDKDPAEPAVVEIYACQQTAAGIRAHAGNAAGGSGGGEGYTKALASISVHPTRFLSRLRSLRVYLSKQRLDKEVNHSRK